MEKIVDLKQIVADSFSIYASKVIKDRSLCDSRDMLKPAARMCMYAQKIDKLTWDKPIQKSIKSVSAALSHFYVNGDAPCYGLLARLGKPFSMRYPLEQFQGNVGTMIETGDEASSRYTEMRLAPLARYLFDTIDKDTIIKWIDNYDNTEQYPSVLPSIGFYNIVNGTTGIGVSLASSIPQWNLCEVNAAIIKLIQNPDIDFDSIYCAPDFATAGILTNASEVKESIRVGSGKSCRLRAKIDYDKTSNMLLVSEMPYGVFTNTIVEQLQQILQEDPNYGIKRINDLTGLNARIELTLDRGVNPTKMIAKLYKDTSLQHHFGINMTMLDNGRVPRIFGWREALQSYIDHIRIVKKRELTFDLNKAIARLHIVEGLLIAVAHIDEVVVIIKNSSTTTQASEALQIRFAIDEIQTKAILDLRLSRLVNLEAIKLESEKKELLAEIDRLNNLLASQIEMDKILIVTLEEVARKFGDERRTRIMNEVILDEQETEIPEIEISATIYSNNTFILAEKIPLSGSSKGRKGAKLTAPKGAIVSDIVYTTTQGSLLAFTDRGKAYAFQLRGLPLNEIIGIQTLVKLTSEEQILTITNAENLNWFKHIIFVTRNGFVKKTLCSEYTKVSKRGLTAIKLEEGDSLIYCGFADIDKDDILVTSNVGNYVRFSTEEVSSIGRDTKGVKAISLKNGEWVIGSTIIRNDLEYLGILTIADNGKGKLSSLEQFSRTSRAIRGNIAQSLEKNEKLIGVAAVRSNAVKVHLLCNSKLISMATSSIQVSSRNTIGTKLIDIAPSTNKINIILEENEK